VARTDDGGLNFSRQQRRDRERRARHDDVLHFQAVLFEQAALARLRVLAQRRGGSFRTGAMSAGAV
jgi:hypothetical protein